MVCYTDVAITAKRDFANQRKSSSTRNDLFRAKNRKSKATNQRTTSKDVTPQKLAFLSFPFEWL